MKKIKLEQYQVRGKHRTYRVLKFPPLPYAWAYWDWDTERYVIDGDHEAFQHMAYAMAALLAAPDRIIYFPIRKKGMVHYYPQNYDAVLSTTTLPFRRSEWIRLRRQLDAAHQLPGFRLRYEPERLCDQLQKLEGSNARYYHALRQRRQEVNVLLGDTVFWALRKESCCAYHATILDMMEHCDPSLGYGLPVDGLWLNSCIGWYLPDNAIREALGEAKEDNP